MPATRKSKAAARRRRPSAVARGPASPARGGNTTATTTMTTRHLGGVQGPRSPQGAPGPVRHRRPIRPVDRPKMLDWLREKLESGEMLKNVWWMVRGKEFAVRWPHAARHGFSSKEDARLFRAWAEHTGLFREGDPEDHKRWKSNFRCAIHSLPNVEEMTPKDGRRGPKAARLYRILDKPIPKKSKAKNRMQASSSDEERRGEDSDSSASTIIDAQYCLPSTVAPFLEVVEIASTSTVEETVQEEVSSTTTACNIPDFKRLGMIIQPKHFNGGCMTVVGQQQQHPQHHQHHPEASQTAPSFFYPSPSSSSSSSSPTSAFTATTTTTSSFISSSSPSSSSSSSPSSSPPSYPIPTTTLLPGDWVKSVMGAEGSGVGVGGGADAGDLEGMRPVGIMTKRPSGSACSGRERSPSGDSGVVPGSPQSLPEVEGGLENLVLVEDVDEKEMLRLAVDEGIEIIDADNIFLGADISVESTQCVQIPSSTTILSFPGGDTIPWSPNHELLDISQSVPMPAVAMEVTGSSNEDFDITCLQSSCL